MVGGVFANFHVACFAEGTRVLTIDGYKFIEHIDERDLLASRNEDDVDAPIEYKPIEEVFIRNAHVMYVSVAGRRIGTTAEHPFYVQDKGWLPAGELSVGDLVNSHDGQWNLVTALELTSDVKKVYNFRVADHHTYFVGDDDWGFNVWVHNSNYPTRGDVLVAMSKKSKKDLLERPTWSDHGRKHMRARTAEQAQAMSDGHGKPAQYDPVTNAQTVEAEALRNGLAYRRPNSRVIEYYYKSDRVVGYDGGESTNWVFVEWARGSAQNKGVFHGRPISPTNMPTSVRKSLGL